MVHHMTKTPRQTIKRVYGKITRTLAIKICRRDFAITTPYPIISFCFDDAPKSAFVNGGKILNENGIKATYYLSLGLLGTDTEVGTIASLTELESAVDLGNELGCHTHDHYDAWSVSTSDYIKSVFRNREKLKRIMPDYRFTSFAYPKSGATMLVKYKLQQHFLCCRAGGQTANIGIADQNHLKSFFLDQRQCTSFASIKNIVDINSDNSGWLIFTTHDISNNPTPFGCNIELFRKTVEYALSSGALILNVSEAFKMITRSYSL